MEGTLSCVCLDGNHKDVTPSWTAPLAWTKFTWSQAPHDSLWVTSGYMAPQGHIVTHRTFITLCFLCEVGVNLEVSLVDSVRIAISCTHPKDTIYMSIIHNQFSDFLLI